MAESHVVSGLIAKRSEMAGLIEHHQKAIARLAAVLMAFAGEIMFRAHQDMSEEITGTPVMDTNAASGEMAEPSLKASASVCENTECNKPVNNGVYLYSKRHFDGKIFCYQCQQKYRDMHPT